MAIKVFVLGRSGAGKSTSVGCLVEAAQRQGKQVICFNDYDILRDMFLKDTQHERFLPTEQDGFIVLDTSVFDTALLRLEQEVHQDLSSNEDVLITIEFTSNNYFRSFQLFSEDFLQDAYFLFIASDLSNCLDRICKRASLPKTKDDFFVAERVLFNHYPCPYIPFRIGVKEINIIKNFDTLDELKQKIEEIAQFILEQDNVTIKSSISETIQSAAEYVREDLVATPVG
jgi:hypothetical protein